MKYSSNLRSRIALFALVPGVICSLLIGIYLTYAMVRDISGYERDMGNAYAGQLAMQVYAPLQAGDISSLRNTAQLALEYPLVRAITFYDANQQEIAHAGPQHPPASVAVPELFQHTIREIESTSSRQLFIPVVKARLGSFVTGIPATKTRNSNDNEVVGWVRLEYSHSFVMLHKYQTILIDTFIVAIILAAAFWFAAPFSDRLAETLRSMARSVRSIGKGEDKATLPTSPIAELQDLSNAISEMQAAMAEQQANLHYHIDQSTQDLRETLETIEIQNIELDLARREAVQASRIKSEFLANTSHEIRTPLNSIIGFSKLLLKTALSNQQQDYLQNIRKSSENLLTIINDVLDLSKIEAGKLVLDYAAFDINETLEEILQILAPGAHEKGLELLHMVYSDVPRHLLGDPLRLKQVLTNLISNAIKFSDQGNIIVRIAAENIDKQQVLLKVEVNDPGRGLANNNQMIFNAFTQLDSSSTREYSGTGLGLAISRKIVEQMGGDIGYHSEPGNTTFWFTVRLDIADRPQADQTQNLLQGRQVLVYDNERLCRLAISHSLTSWGVQPILTDSIEQIIPAMERHTDSEHPIDAIVLGLPVRHRQQDIISTVNSAQILREQYRCPVLLCTPTSIKQSLAQLQDSKIIQLPKPVTENRLYLALCQALQLSEPALNPYSSDNDAFPAAGIRVLAVDDNPSNLKLISTMLQDLGAIVLLAENGEEAVQVFRETGGIDLILMDIQMPVMDGIEATKRIRQLENTSGRHTPVIALTAHALAEQRQQLLMSGFDDYLSKPASEQQLARMLEKWHPDEMLPATSIRRATQEHAGRDDRNSRCVDRAAALQASGNRIEIATEMLELLLASLGEERDRIMGALDGNNIAQAEMHIHKLHGACCYCGVTELKDACNAMETLIKKNMLEELPAMAVQFNAAVDNLLQWRQLNQPADFFRHG